MTEEPIRAIMLVTVILTARKPQPLLEANEDVGKPNLETAFWAEVYTKKSIERAPHIFHRIDAKSPA